MAIVWFVFFCFVLLFHFGVRLGMCYRIVTGLVVVLMICLRGNKVGLFFYSFSHFDDTMKRRESPQSLFSLFVFGRLLLFFFFSALPTKQTLTHRPNPPWVCVCGWRTHTRRRIAPDRVSERAKAGVGGGGGGGGCGGCRYRPPPRVSFI